MVKYVINERYAHLKDEILAVPVCFDKTGEVVHDYRNVIKILDIAGIRLNVKSFKTPHIINRIAYAYFRKSKAQRSFEYALKLQRLGINTPEPVAYIVYSDVWGITRSFYLSLQIACDFTFKGLTEQQPADLEVILRAFTRFTHDFHRKGVYFIDHSPGNTLIERLPEGGYRFNLVDLNRIDFKTISPDEGLRNFYRLNADDNMIRIMADEYALLTHGDKADMTAKLMAWTNTHNRKVQEKRARKIARKQN